MLKKASYGQNRRQIDRERYAIPGIAKVAFSVIFFASLFFASISAQADQGNIELIYLDNVDYVFPVVNGFARIYTGTLDEKGYPEYGKYGYIDKAGHLIIEPIYAYAEDFDANGYAKVSDGLDWGLIDTTGTLLVPIEYDDVGSYSEGLVAVWKRWEGLSYLDFEGNVVLHFPDRAGEYAITPNESMDFVNGYAVLEKTIDEKAGGEFFHTTCEYCIINKNGGIVVDFDNFDTIERIEGGFYRAYGGENYVFVDRNLDLKAVLPWDNKVYVTQYNGKWYLDAVGNSWWRVIDLETGDDIIPKSKSRIEFVSDRYCQIETDTGYGIVNIETGETVSPTNLSQVELIHGDCFVFEVKDENKNTSYGIYDVSQQKYVLELQPQDSFYGYYVNGIYYGWGSKLDKTTWESTEAYYVCFDIAQPWECVKKVYSITHNDGQTYVFIQSADGARLIDSVGNVTILPFDCVDIRRFADNKYLYFTEEDKIGILTSTGDIQVSAQWDMVEVLDKKTALVRNNDMAKIAYIDGNGMYLGREPYYVSDRLLKGISLSSNWIMYEEDDHVGVLRRDGSIVVPAEYDRCIDFYCDACIMEKEGNTFYVHMDGTVLELDVSAYDSYTLVSNQLIRVSKVTKHEGKTEDEEYEYDLIRVDGAHVMKFDAAPWEFDAKGTRGYNLLYIGHEKLYFCVNDSIYLISDNASFDDYQVWTQVLNRDHVVILQWDSNGERHCVLAE